ncbi:MAG: acyltransferase [Acetobacter sp.]
MMREEEIKIKLNISRDNNLQFLRLVCALMVWVSHSFAICYQPEPIVGRGYNVGSYGSLGVFGFFTISGYLITLSYLRLDSLKHFFWNRFLRIAPALWMAVVLGVLLAYVATPVGDRFSDFLAHPDVWHYIIGNGTLLNINYSAIRNGFYLNRFDVINGPLWTLPLEVRMYIFVSVLGVLSILENKSFSLLLIVLSFLGADCFYNSILYKIVEPSSHQAVYPLLYFLSGMFFALRKIHLKKSWFILSLAVAVFAVIRPINLLAQVICTAYVFYYVSFRGNILRSVFNKIGDYSYGIYVYAFPIQQFSYHMLKSYFNISADPVGLMAVSGVMILGVSCLSWHYIEEPALKLKNWTGRRVNQPAPATKKTQQKMYT